MLLERRLTPREAAAFGLVNEMAQGRGTGDESGSSANEPVAAANEEDGLGEIDVLKAYLRNLKEQG